MKITLEVDRKQIEILLMQIESMFSIASFQKRSAAAIDAEIEAAAASWQPEYSGGFEYEVVKIAPVYRQLVAAMGPTDAEVGTVHVEDDLFEFVAALRFARGGSADGKGVRHAS